MREDAHVSPWNFRHQRIIEGSFSETAPEGSSWLLEGSRYCNENFDQELPKPFPKLATKSEGSKDNEFSKSKSLPNNEESSIE